MTEYTSISDIIIHLHYCFCSDLVRDDAYIILDDTYVQSGSLGDYDEPFCIKEGLKEITTTQEIIFNITNHYPRVFRFPYGAVNKSVLKEINIPTVLWDVDSLDWQDHTTASIVKKVKGSVRKNSILLFHDFKYYNKEAITIVIKDLQKEGYTFVSVSKLLKFASEEDIKTGIIHFNG